MAHVLMHAPHMLQTHALDFTQTSPRRNVQPTHTKTQPRAHTQSGRYAYARKCTHAHKHSCTRTVDTLVHTGARTPSRHTHACTCTNTLASDQSGTRTTTHIHMQVYLSALSIFVHACMQACMHACARVGGCVRLSGVCGADVAVANVYLYERGGGTCACIWCVYLRACIRRPSMCMFVWRCSRTCVCCVCRLMRIRLCVRARVHLRCAMHYV